MARDARSGSYPQARPELTPGNYLRGYQVGGVQELPRGNHKAGVIIQSLTVLDRGLFRSGFDVYLFDSQPSIISADAQPFDITDDEMLKCSGVISILNHEYVSTASNAVMTRRNIGIGIKCVSYNVYAVAVSRNAFTIGLDTEPFTFRYHFELERV